MSLYKCLKKLLLEVISTRDSRHQEVYARQVFAWFLKQLYSTGAISKEEYEKETASLVPNDQAMSKAMRLIIC